VAEVIVVLDRLVDVGDVLEIPPLLKHSPSEHVPHHDYALRRHLLSLLRLYQLLPLYALSDILLVDSNISLRKLHTVACVLHLLAQGLTSEPLCLVELSEDDDGFDVLWNFGKIDGDAFVHIDLFFWEAKTSLQLEERTELFIYLTKHKLVHDFSFLVQEEQSTRQIVVVGLFIAIGGPSKADLFLVIE
jgi:hypothetical protein